jgi:hypothetical protein
MKRIILGAALVGLCASLAAADEFTLVNGKKITGVQRTDPKMPDKVIIEVGIGTIVLDKSQVSSVSKGRTTLHDYEDKYKAIENSRNASDFMQLIAWCRQNKVTRYVDDLAQKVLALDPNHEGAHQALGHQKVGGKWMTFEEAQAAKGLVQMDGRWVTKSEAELVKARRQEAEERRKLAQKERELAREEERYRRQQEIDDYNAFMRRQMMQLDGYFYSPSFAFTTPYFRPYWHSPYLRSRRYYQDGWMYSGGSVPTFDVLRFFAPRP